MAGASINLNLYAILRILQSQNQNGVSSSFYQKQSGIESTLKIFP